MSIRSVSILLVLILSVSAYADEPAIPEGIYVASANDECIVVGKSEISFYMKDGQQIDKQLWDQSYRYTLQNDGRIQPVIGAVTHTENSFSDSAWYWQKNVIVRVDALTGTQTVFTSE